VQFGINSMSYWDKLREA